MYQKETTKASSVSYPAATHGSQYGPSTSTSMSFNGQSGHMAGATTHPSMGGSSYHTSGTTYQGPITTKSKSRTTNHSSSAGGTVMVSHGGSPGGQNVRKVSEVTTSEKFIMPSQAYEQSSRKVSSVVVFEEAETIPEKNIRYVEVPQYEEVIKHVARKEIREVEKFVPRIVEEWIERIVEVPQMEEVVRHVEVPQIQEVVKHVPKIEIVDRPFEVIKEVARLEINKVEKVVEIGAEVVEVPKAILVEERVEFNVYDDKEAMLVVSQKVKPVIIDGVAKEVVVDVIEYEPEILPVDIHVAKFVDQELVLVGAKETIHRCVTVSAAQYNSMLRYLNVHLNAKEVANLPYLADHQGQVSFLPQEYQWFAPQEGLKIYGYRAGQIWGQGTVVVNSNSNQMTEAEIRSRQAELDRQFQQIFQQFESERTRRIHAIEDFNRRQEENVRMQLGDQAHSGASMSYSVTTASQPTAAIGYESYGTGGTSMFGAGTAQFGNGGSIYGGSVRTSE